MDNSTSQSNQSLENLNKELTSAIQNAPAPAEAEKKASRTPRKRSTSSRTKSVTVLTKGKRKRAIARASLVKGPGEIYVNNVPLEKFTSPLMLELIMEPVNFSNETKTVAGSSTVKISVIGGGVMSQAQAVRSALAKAIVKASGSSSLQSEMLHYDRSMLVDDVRQTEPKKFLGPKARSRFQTSYR